MVVLLRGVLISIDVVYFEGSVHLDCSHTLVLLFDQFHRQQVVFDIDDNEAEYIWFIMYFADVGVETIGLLRDIFNAKQYFLFDFVWIAAYTLVLLHDIDVGVDDFVEDCHEIIDSLQIQITTLQQWLNVADQLPIPIFMNRLLLVGGGSIMKLLRRWATYRDLDLRGRPDLQIDLRVYQIRQPRNLYFDVMFGR